MIQEIKAFLREIRKMWEPHFTGKSKIEYKRAKNNQGHFVADDPKTKENEAWVDGEAPEKKTKKTKKRSKKRGTKKRTTKKRNTKKN